MSSPSTDLRFYCHQCSTEVNTYLENDERVCVNCKETFVEELETPPVQQEQQPPPQPRAQLPPQMPFPNYVNLFNLPQQNAFQAQPQQLPIANFIQQMLSTLSNSLGPQQSQGFGEEFNFNGYLNT